jgi:hypothetical protein
MTEHTTMAMLFVDTMSYIWSDEDRGDKTTTRGMLVRAVANTVKTHRINDENAFEVLAIAFPETHIEFDEREAPAPASSEDERVRYKATFADGSRALVWATHGIGSMVEPVA